MQITPHSDFGLGLRLEAQAEGLPAVAGSYKKHPLTGGRLPAERAGKIILGDELVSVNGISLEGMTFDDIISTVRQIGSAAQGGTLTMRFRALKKNRMLRENLSNLSLDPSYFDESLEVIRQGAGLEGDQVSVLVGADAEIQQEFGRIVATIPHALPSGSTSRQLLVLLPWHYGKGAPAPYKVRGAMLMVSALGRTITASRVEVRNGLVAETCGKLMPLGSVTLESSRDNSDGISGDIVSLVYIKTCAEGWCVGSCDKHGKVQLVFIEIAEDMKGEEENVTKLQALFRTHAIFDCNDAKHVTSDEKEYLLRASSIDMLGIMPVGRTCKTVGIWSSTPFVSTTLHENTKDDGNHRSSYSLSEVTHHGSSDSDEAILDFRWCWCGRLSMACYL